MLRSRSRSLIVMEATLRILGLVAACACASVGAPPPPPSPPPAMTRSVDWWLGDYTGAYVDQNKAFLESHSAEATGVLHCCRGVVMLANGSMSRSTDAIDGPFFRNLTGFEEKDGLKPVLVPVGPSTDALLSDVASRSVPELAALPGRYGFDGFVVDYEPHANLTDTHAQRLAAWIKALATALHAGGHTLAVCVSDWGIIGPQYYGLLATAGADRYISMGSTYKYQPITGRLNVKAMVKAFPLGSITVGIGTVVPAACHCVYGNTGNCTGDYGWDPATLGSFVDFVQAQGVTRLAVWRADIYPAYCTPEGVAPWMFPIFASFLANHTSAARNAPSR